MFCTAVFAEFLSGKSWVPWIMTIPCLLWDALNSPLYHPWTPSKTFWTWSSGMLALLLTRFPTCNSCCVADSCWEDVGGKCEDSEEEEKVVLEEDGHGGEDNCWVSKIEEKDEKWLMEFVFEREKKLWIVEDWIDWSVDLNLDWRCEAIYLWDESLR